MPLIAITLIVIIYAGVREPGGLCGALLQCRLPTGLAATDTHDCSVIDRLIYICSVRICAVYTL